MGKNNLQNIDNQVDVFLVDNNHFFRQGLGAALSQEPNIEIVGESIVEGAFEGICSLTPRVVMVGITRLNIVDIQLIRRVAHDFPKTKTIVLSDNSNDHDLVRAITAGACAFSGKDIEVMKLADMIRQAAGGELLVAEALMSKPPVLSQVIKHFQDLVIKGKTVATSNSPITEREAEVLTHVACGYGNKQIATTFGISEQTIKNHMASILRKLPANDRTHAAVMAIEHGWISTSIGRDRI